MSNQTLSFLDSLAMHKACSDGDSENAAIPPIALRLSDEQVAASTLCLGS